MFTYGVLVYNRSCCSELISKNLIMEHLPNYEFPRKGCALLSGPIPPFLNTKSSLLLPTNGEKCASMSLHKFIWIEMESIPFD
jgi:hypothetical protein